MYLPEKILVSELRADIRNERRKLLGEDTGGGHFYTPFWSDVKLHVLGEADLSQLTKARIEKSRNKKYLYPRLETGFLKLWNRGGNQQVAIIDKSPKGKYETSNDNLIIKVENIMAISLNGKERLGYPYWFPEPALSEEAARVGLWVMGKALKEQNEQNMRIFDIMRSEFYSLQLNPLQGNEEQTLISNFERITKLREKLEAKYD